MVNLKINDVNVCVEDGTTILEAAREHHIDVPNLCYLKDINEISACRVCCVEIEGEDTLVTSCNNVVKEGMVIKTNSPRVRNARRTNIELILSQHKMECATCVRSGTCLLQQVATDLGVLKIPYENDFVVGKKAEWTKQYPLVRDINKCIKCMRCAQICDKIQSVSIWDLSGSGSRTTIDVSGTRKIENTECVLCGQCVTHCPTGALYERDDTKKAFDAFADKDKVTVIQIAPAVRTGWAETLGGKTGELPVEKIVAILKKMGADYVFDTTFTADLTIMEEGSEFLERLKSGDLDKLPMFTSCCPGWVRFLKGYYPELSPRLSSAKSPQQMFGALTKTWFAEKIGVDPSKIYSISVMPCLAKKSEIDIPGMKSNGDHDDVDVVLTTRELIRMIRAENIDVFELEDAKFDVPLDEGTGAGVIFGSSGGVMEAALRSAYFLVTGENPDVNTFAEARGINAYEEGYKETVYHVNGIEIRCAIVSGLYNARKLMNAILRGEKKYHFVEVMACPGGCAGGGGQPIDGTSESKADVRGEVLYNLDKSAHARFSHENKAVNDLYSDYLEKPLSHRSHELLHVDHSLWEMKNK